MLIEQFIPKQTPDIGRRLSSVIESQRRLADERRLDTVAVCGASEDAQALLGEWLHGCLSAASLEEALMAQRYADARVAS